MHIRAMITAAAALLSGTAGANPSAQASGEAWFSCLSVQFVGTLTKGDLRLMSDSALTKRVEATFAACGPQESAYAALAPDPAAGKKAIHEGRAQFRGLVIDQWAKLQDEARRQGAK
jgi:hypothetical protein